MDANELVQIIRDKYQSNIDIEVKTVAVFTILTLVLSDDYKLVVTHNSKNGSVKLQVRDVIEIYTAEHMDKRLLSTRIYAIALDANVPSSIMKPLMG